MFQLAENRTTRISVTRLQTEVDAAGALVFLTLGDKIQDERVETTYTCVATDWARLSGVKNNKGVSLAVKLSDGL